MKIILDNCWRYLVDILIFDNDALEGFWIKDVKKSFLEVNLS